MGVKRVLDQLYAYAPVPVSSSSLFFHLVVSWLKSPRTRLEKGIFIISVDVDVGNKELGIINEGRNDANIARYFSEYSIGEMEERALPLLVNLFNDFDISATFAVRGQITELDDSVLNILLKSPVKHDIGVHGYYHRRFKSLSHREAENELEMISIGMKKFNLTPRSFVFPLNSVAHLNLLETFGYKCYRSESRFLNNRAVIEKHGGLYDIPPGFFLGRGGNSAFLRKLLDVSVAKKLIFHIWFHPWNFGENYESIRRNIEKWLLPNLVYAKEKVRKGELTFETMLSAAEKFARLHNKVI